MRGLSVIIVLSVVAMAAAPARQQPLHGPPVTANSADCRDSSGKNDIQGASPCM